MVQHEEIRRSFFFDHCTGQKYTNDFSRTARSNVQYYVAVRAQKEYNCRTFDGVLGMDFIADSVGF